MELRRQRTAKVLAINDVNSLLILVAREKLSKLALSVLILSILFSLQNTSSMCGYFAVPMRRDTFQSLRSVQTFVR